MLTYFQKKKLIYLFGIYDDDKSGELMVEDFSDFAAKLQKRFEYETGSKEHEELVFRAVGLFHRLLKDIEHPQSQTIGLQEWLDFFDDEIVNGKDDEMLDEYIELIIGYLFDLFDTNHDGFLQFEEYIEIFRLYGIDTEYVEKAFVNLDANNDRKLSRYELFYAVEVFLTSDDPLMKENWIFGNWDSVHEEWLYR